jgi:hypothetical protein
VTFETLEAMVAAEPETEEVTDAAKTAGEAEDVVESAATTSNVAVQVNPDINFRRRRAAVEDTAKFFTAPPLPLSRTDWIVAARSVLSVAAGAAVAVMDTEVDTLTVSVEVGAKLTDGARVG